MDENRFWELIDQSRQESAGDVWQQAVHLTDLLVQLDLDEIVSFQQHFNAFMGKAYRADLWAAAYIVNQGCSDDAFADFLGWLIAQGKKVYDAILTDPDTLRHIFDDLIEPEGTADCEDMLYVPTDAYRRKTQGKELPEELLDNKPQLLQGSLLPPNEVQRLLPNLWRRSGEDDGRIHTKD